MILGYALSSLTRPLIALSSSWPQVLAIRALDRTGKGIRGAPRDAMLAAHAEASSRGRIFGFHRAMDHTGAVVGPIIATIFLAFFPGQYRWLFALTAIPGALAVATLFRVEEPASASRPARTLERSERPIASGSDVRTPPEGTVCTPRDHLVIQSRKFRRRVPVTAACRRDGIGDVPAVAVGRASRRQGVALDVGRGTLRSSGRRYVIVIGWVIYSLVYLGFALVTNAVAFVTLFLIYGVHFALAEGAEKALVADLTPAHRQGTSFGLYYGVLGVGMLIASIAFGVVYDRVSPAAAFIMGAALSAAAAVLLIVVRLPNPHQRVATAKS